MSSRSERDRKQGQTKHWALWRVTEDDPDSSLYAASADASIVVAYMARHVL
ncbi:MAG TPA: hypothetical protein VHN16_11230 [Streptosporangiaceae bacterium]|nr:hypothetical protein [Streptosporangiaceae bacterium]